MWDANELARIENPETMSLFLDAQSLQRRVDNLDEADAFQRKVNSGSTK